MQLSAVDREHVGMRLDLFLARRGGGAAAGEWSRSGIQKMIEAGRILVNGRKTKPSARLKLCDLIEIHEWPIREAGLVPEAIPLNVLYEDAYCIAINKPPGMVVHPAAGRSSGTLVNALLHHCPDLGGIGGERRPGIVHRLDKDTSGVMIVAKEDSSFRNLAAQFKERRVRKEYLALVWGRVARKEGIIHRPIGRHRSNRKRMSSLYSGRRLREAITEWRVEASYRVAGGAARFSWVSWLRVLPRTGRTHQIRVHLADQGYPIVGDPVYGWKRQAPSATGAAIAEIAAFPRQALHAERLGLRHPRSGEPVQICAPLFADMENLLEVLRQRADKIEYESAGG